jgi:hypothetical protein
MILNRLAIRSALGGAAIAALSLPLVCTNASAAPGDFTATASVKRTTITTTITNSTSVPTPCGISYYRDINEAPLASTSVEVEGNDSASASFENVAPGDYFVTWVCVNALGQAWGTAPPLSSSQATAAPIPVTVAKPCHGSICLGSGTGSSGS